MQLFWQSKKENLALKVQLWNSNKTSLQAKLKLIQKYLPIRFYALIKEPSNLTGLVNQVVTFTAEM